MKRNGSFGIVIIFVNMLLAPAVLAAVHLPSLFSDHMVLQRDTKAPVWGWAKPGQQVTVRFAGQTLTAKADPAGKWRVTLAPMKADAHGRPLTVKADNTVTVHDVLVGEVWLCSGQSNMEFPIRGWTHPLHVEQVIAQARHPTIRLINVPNVPAAKPRDDFRGRWLVCNPQTVQHFTAAGYFFAVDLQKRLHVPIGLIEADWGGTRIQPWIAPRGYRMTRALKFERRWLARAQARWQRDKAAYIATADNWVSLAQSARRQGKQIPDPPAPPRNPVATNRQAPTALYNGMIAPLVGYAMRGALWYQGESNTRYRQTDYLQGLEALIGGWRSLWAQGDFPFIIVQIAPFAGYGDRAPLIWKAEIQATKQIRNVGIASTMDIGNLENIHPRDKQDVGERLALWALANVYGRKNLVYAGPQYQSMTATGGKAVISFSHLGSGLTSRDGKPLNWFQIAGKDGKFVDAKATIQGDTVVVSAPVVAHPTAVRFAWSYKAVPNLMNKEGLPALPFEASR